MKRTPLHLATMLAVLLTGSAAFADFEQDIVRQLQDMGFSQVEVTRTLLGRVRITAAGADGTREIILNPNTGEILRDLWLRQEGGSSDRTLLDGGKAAKTARRAVDLRAAMTTTMMMTPRTTILEAQATREVPETLRVIRAATRAAGPVANPAADRMVIAARAAMTMTTIDRPQRSG